MRKRVHLTEKSNDEIEKIKKESKKRKTKDLFSKKIAKKNIKGRKIREIKVDGDLEKDSWFRNLTKREVISYGILFLVDIVLVIFCARQNVVHYVDYGEIDFFVSKTRYLLWGRNYVNLIIIAFFYIYGCVMNRFFLQRKNTKKFLIWFLVSLLVINVTLFLIFTKRVY